MNNIRRKSLEELKSKLDEVKGDIEILRDEGQEYIDNMPESLQGGERASNAENAVRLMDDAINDLENVLSNIEEASA